MIHRVENMEQAFIADVYQSVGMSVGAAFSSEDVSRLYSKVFHFPSDTGEAQTAMEKIAGGDRSWSCVAENVFDVLLEMEREREKTEQLYWDLQLLTVGNLNNVYVMDKPINIDSNVLNCLHQNTNPNAFKKSCNQSDSDSLQVGRLVGRTDPYGSVKTLKKAGRQCWARLASEGVQSLLPPPWQSKRIGVQAWGCVSLSEVLLLVEVKYDVVTHLLYTEMLQEHHTPSVWETLLPWQQHKEHEELEHLAEEILVSGDVLHLAELPGAFRIYRDWHGSREHSWSAIYLMHDLHMSRQQEKDTLTVLGERLGRESMRLLCLHIRLATLRAQREKMSYAALLAARQSWETWPHINSPCRAEQAALWLQGEDKDQNEDLSSVSLQQLSVLQLLVLSQEQERKHLVKLLQGISLEDLQGKDCTVPSTEERNKKAALRNSCIKRLRQIHASLQTHNETQTATEQTNLHIQLKSEAQPQIQPHISSKPALWYQYQVKDYALLLLTDLMEIQEVHVMALLPELIDMSVQHLQALQAKYESELQEQHFTNLLQLLMSDGPLSSGPILPTYSNLIDNCSNEQTTTQSCCTEPVKPFGSNGPAGDHTSNSVSFQAADGTNTQDVCTGCGAVMEELPYLEILCVSDATSNSAETGVHMGEAGSTTMCVQSYEKQGSLITLAWSKPPDGDTDYDAESADGGTGQILENESSVKTTAQSSEISSTAEQTQGDETSGESLDEESGSTGHRDAQSPDQQCTQRQLTLEERPVVDQPQKGEGTVEVEIATQPELWDLRGRDPSDAEDQKYNSQTNGSCDLAKTGVPRESTLMERERVTEPLSAMERERTMRNLVDIQKKVEQRQQRDRERQLFRVQERLSIIQNRKAEEDLLGLKHTDRLRHLTQDLPQEDKKQQKTVVKERLEQLRRERSYVMQSKRDRNTTGFKELLGPVTLHRRETEDGTD